MIKIALFLIPILLFGGNDVYQQGKKLYFAKGCNGCHGVTAGGTNLYPALADRKSVV
nr:c-type cytochrome [uncultured Sulfuricurvum sp.]